MKIIFGLFLVLINALFNLTLAANPTKNSIQDYLTQWRIKNNVPGVVVLIKTKDSQHIFSNGFIDLNKQASIKEDTLFGIGSITKTIISTMILKLEAEGKLSINDKIGKYFPQYLRWKNITIKQLLNMTSGIFNYMNDDQYTADLNSNYKQSWGNEQLINLAYKHADDFKPGKGWNYTNTGYLLLGKIIESITKKDLHQTLQDTFFDPLNIHHTFYQEDNYPQPLFSQMAMGYYNDAIIKPSLPHNLGAAAGGIVMSSSDLSTFIDHLFIKKDILPNRQLDEMLTGVQVPAGKIKPANSRYGLGLGITAKDNKALPNKVFIWYTGVTPYHTAIYLWVPSTQTIIVVLASFNRHNDKNYDILFPEKDFVKKLLSQ